MQLTGQIAVVTGAGRGIGRAIALEFAAQGATVVVVSRSQDQLASTAEAIRAAGGNAHSMPADVTDKEAVGRLVAGVLAEHGYIDLLVNDAGSFTAIGPVWEVDPDRWWQDVTTNVRGTFLMCRSVLPSMIARKRGKIINLSGGGAMSPFAYGSGYGCSKAAVVRFTETVQMEVQQHGIRTYALGPGLVRTAMTEYQVTSAEGQRYLPNIATRFVEGGDVPPERAGKLAAFLASPDGDSLAGRAISVADDWEALAQRGDELAANELYTLRLRR